jgi:integrase/recombinase XerC
MLPTVTGSAELAAAPADRTAELLAAFFAGRSPHTIAAYRADLGDFAAFVSADTVEAAAGRLLAHGNGAANGLALAWRSHLVGLGRSPATINRRLSALRAVVALARTLGLITWGLDIKNLRAEAYRDTRGPERKGVLALLAAATSQSDRRKAARDVALVRLLHDTALRRGEVCGLDLADIDLAGNRVMVRGKGKMQKVAITLPEPTKTALAAWIAERGTQPGPLFLAVDRWAGRTPQRLTGAGLWHVIKTLGVVAGMTARPHATQGNVRAVQRFSRHADVRTLQVYDDNREDLGGKVAAMIAA